MNILFSLYLLVLFLVLTPGVLLSLPKNGSKFTVTAVHGGIFAVILYVTGHYVWTLTSGVFEGYKEGKTDKKKADKKKADKKKKKKG